MLNIIKYYRDRAALLTGDMEEDLIFADDDVGNAVAIVGHWAETAARAHAVRLFLKIQHVCLTCF